MKSKLRNHIGYLVLSLALTFPQGLSSQSHNSQYSSYSAYSTLPQEGILASSVVGSRSSVSQASNLQTSLLQSEQATNGVEGNSEQSQKTHQLVGHNPQPQGSHNMYYYETYPVPKPQQRCTYTGNGMKCQYRRESPAADSYTSAAQSESQGSYGVPMEQYDGGSSYGEMDEEGEEKGGGGSLGGIVGLIGLKGLKGLKALAPFAFLLPLLPILLPLLPILLLPVLVIMALPLIILLLFFPVIVFQPSKRSLEDVARSMNLTFVARMAKDVFESEECIEKISCEIGRMSRKYHVSNWLDRLTDALPKTNQYSKRVTRGLEQDDHSTTDKARENDSHGECSRFACNPKGIFAKTFM